MIIEYHRPKDETQALELLNRGEPVTIPLGGGTVVSKTSREVAVVDLQLLDLNYIREEDEFVAVGSMTTLEDLLAYFGKESAIGKAIVIEAGKNIRSMATIGGTLVTDGGRSPLLAVLAAMVIKLVWKPGDQILGIDDWLASRDAGRWGKYISEIRLPKNSNIVFESVARSPLDQPIICCAASLQPDGSLRLAFGGFGEVPVLAYAGDRRGDFAKSAAEALKSSGDEWASSAYRTEVGTKLAQRLVAALSETK